ncbi:MAG: ABC transporter permease [Anaerolineae bacterium]|nr:ABC transporter permease [Anaerolineae bacterium]
MGRYLLRRLLLLAVTLLVTSLIIFALTQLLPGDIARLILGRDASEQAKALFREEFGLNDPALTQYARWLGGFVTGEWGRSYSAGNPAVRPLVLDRLGNSLILAGYTLLLSIPLSILLGIIAALRENTWVDGTVSIGALALIGLPEFVSGIILINLFALQLGWFESTSLIQDSYTLLDWVRVLTLPAITASFVLVGYVARMTRAGMIDELKKPYVRTATLKGIPRRRVIVRHVLRNGLLPTITVIAISVGWLIGGIVVIENVFNYPGLGSLLVTAVKQKNLPVLQASVMIIVFFFAVSNLAADLLYAALNPRIRLT